MQSRGRRKRVRLQPMERTEKTERTERIRN
jgi:hypothetical protein